MRQGLVVEVRPHVVRDAHHERAQVLEVAVQRRGLLEELELDHVPVVAAGSGDEEEEEGRYNQQPNASYLGITDSKVCLTLEKRMTSRKKTLDNLFYRLKTTARRKYAFCGDDETEDSCIPELHINTGLVPGVASEDIEDGMDNRRARHILCGC